MPTKVLGTCMQLILVGCKRFLAGVERSVRECPRQPLLRARVQEFLLEGHRRNVVYTESSMTTSSVPRCPPAILATCCIPWADGYVFAEDIFRRQVQTLANGLTRDLYIFGTAGEGYAVTDSQYYQICRVFFAETMAHHARPMVGVISLSLGTIIERITSARDMGFRRFQVSLPAWGALSDGEMAVFFREVCGRFRDCQFLHYNLPRARRMVTAREYRRLAQEHPNLVATKNSTSSTEILRDLLDCAPELMHFLTETGYAHASALGPCGLLISVATTNFAAAREFFRAGQARDHGTLATMERELVLLTDILLKEAGSEAHMDGAYDKLLCRCHHPDFPLRLLPPYNGLSEAVYASTLAKLQAALPHWMPETPTSMAARV